jgi:hypothetical protein
MAAAGLRISPANYDWYQRRFEARVVAVYGQQGSGSSSK